MRLLWFRVLLFTAAGISACAADIPKIIPQPAASVTGVLIGRSGKPLANGRVFLAKILGDEEDEHARVVLRGLPFAPADAQGRFKLTGVAPDKYTIVYYPKAGASVAPAEFSIKSLSAVERSILPLMRNVEIGTSEPLAERTWGPAFTLLKGHTFWGQGSHMRIWNATVRRGTSGPYLEFRKGHLWEVSFTDKADLRFEAWGF